MSRRTKDRLIELFGPWLFIAAVLFISCFVMLPVINRII